MTFKEKIFKNISRFPNWLNRLLMRCNRVPNTVYGNNYAILRQRLAANEITADQTISQLLRVTNHAIQKVPHYQQKYSPTEIKSLDQFNQTIDYIDKYTVMENWQSFVDPGANRNHYVTGTTGGTSGRPLTLMLPADRYVTELGSIHHHWAQFGFRHQPRAVLRASQIERNYEINPITKEYVFDGFDFSDDHFSIIHQVMKKYRIEFLHCFPSSGFAFANFLKNNNLDYSFIKAFLLSSENILDYQTDLFKRMGIAYATHYGHSEKLLLATNCPHSDLYHPVPGYGHLELIDTQTQKLITEEGQFGEMVGSTVNNFGFPLLRYRTGDFAQYQWTDCACGYHGMSLDNLCGRELSKIYNRDGSYVTTTALNLHNDLYTVIEGIQYVQNIKGKLVVNIIPGSEYSNEHEQRFYQQFVDKLASDSVVEIRHVTQLKRQPNGKLLLLLSTIEDV